MRFKDSDLEVRYNKFWNKEVVDSYQLFQNHPKFTGEQFFSYPSIDSLIGKYCHGTINIIANLMRQYDQFEDKDYVKAYLDNIEQEVIDDIKVFQQHSNKSPLTCSQISLVILEIHKKNQKFLDDKKSDEEISEAETSDYETSEAETSEAETSDSETSEAENSDAGKSDSEISDADMSDVEIDEEFRPTLGM